MDVFGDIAEDPEAFGRFNAGEGIEGNVLRDKMSSEFKDNKWGNTNAFDGMKVNYDESTKETTITNKNGDKMTTSELAKKANGDFSVDPSVGPDIGGYFEFLTSGDFDKTDPRFEKVENAQTTNFNNNPLKKVQDRMALSKKNAAAIAGGDDTLNDPKTREKTIDKYNEDITEKKKEGSNWDTAKSWLKWIGATAGGVLIYDEIKQHQNECNGCWIVNSKTGDKCKIMDLSCDPANVDPGANGSVCPICTDVLGGSNGQSNSSANNFGVSGNTCPSLSWAPGFASNIQDNNSTKALLTLPIPSGYTNNYPGGEADGNGNCLYTNASTTTSLPCGGKQSCTGVTGPCDDTTCNSSTYTLPPNCILKCVNMTLLEALDDMLPGILPDAPNNILSSIIKYLLYALGIILGVYLIYIVGKWVFSKMTSSHSESGPAKIELTTTSSPKE
jgi:hypothetical protein